MTIKKKYAVLFTQSNVFFVKDKVDMINLGMVLHVTTELKKAKLYNSFKMAKDIARKYLDKGPKVVTIKEEVTYTAVGISELID